jgi:proteasome assembly chaperone (PAC2) family protein
MITIDDKTYTEDDLSATQVAQVQRIESLRIDLAELEMRAQEINVLLSEYANSLNESLSASEEEDEETEE